MTNETAITVPERRIEVAASISVETMRAAAVARAEARELDSDPEDLDDSDPGDEQVDALPGARVRIDDAIFVLTLVRHDLSRIEKRCGLGWTHIAGSCGVHVLDERDGTLSIRITNGVLNAKDGAGAMVLLRVELEFAYDADPWPARASFKRIGGNRWSFMHRARGDRRFVLRARGVLRVRVRCKGARESTEALLAAREPSGPGMRLTERVRVPWMNERKRRALAGSGAATAYAFLGGSLGTGRAGGEVRFEAGALTHGLGFPQAGPGGGESLDFLPGSGFALLDLLRAHLWAERHPVDALDAVSGEPLRSCAPLSDRYDGTRGWTTRSSLAAYAYKTQTGQARPLAWPREDQAVLDEVLSGDALVAADVGMSTWSDPQPVDRQHERRVIAPLEAAAGMYDDELSRMDLESCAADAGLEHSEANVAVMLERAKRNAGQGDGQLGTRAVSWAADTMRFWIGTLARAEAIAEATALVLTESGVGQRLQPAHPDPILANSAMAFSPNGYVSGIPTTDEISQIMEATIAAWMIARSGRPDAALAICSRQLVDEPEPGLVRGMLVRLRLAKAPRKSMLSLWGRVPKFIGVSRGRWTMGPDGIGVKYVRGEASRVPTSHGGGWDYFPWVAAAIGLWLDPNPRPWIQALERVPVPGSELPHVGAKQLEEVLLSRSLGFEQTGPVEAWLHRSRVAYQAGRE